MAKFSVISQYANFSFAFKNRQYQLTNGYVEVEVDDKEADEFKAHFTNNPALTPFARIASNVSSAKSFSAVVANSATQVAGAALGAVSSNNLLAPKDPVLEAMNQATANEPDNAPEGDTKDDAGSENEAGDAKDEASAQATAQALVAQPQSPIKAMPTIKVK